MSLHLALDRQFLFEGNFFLSFAPFVVIVEKDHLLVVNYFSFHPSIA